MAVAVEEDRGINCQKNKQIEEIVRGISRLEMPAAFRVRVARQKNKATDVYASIHLSSIFLTLLIRAYLRIRKHPHDGMGV